MARLHIAPYLGASFSRVRSRVPERHSWANTQPLATLARASGMWSLLVVLIQNALFMSSLRPRVAPLARTMSLLLKGTGLRFI